MIEALKARNLEFYTEVQVPNSFSTMDIAFIRANRRTGRDKLITIYVMECKTPNHFYVGMTTKPMQDIITSCKKLEGPRFTRRHRYKSVAYTNVAGDVVSAQAMIKLLQAEWLAKDAGNVVASAFLHPD